MKDFYKVVDNGYITGIGTNGNESADAITDAEYNHLLSLIRSAPTAQEGFIYKLRADNLEWEQVEMPEPEPSEENADISDYENALSELGVQFND